MSKRTRRHFLSSCALAGLAGLAGCSGKLEGGESEIEIGYPPKEVSDGLWTSEDKSEIPFERKGLSGTGAVRTYINSRISDTIQKRFAGQFSRPLTLGFAIKLKYEGVGSTLVTADKLHKNIKPIILERMKNRGLSDFVELAKKTYANDDRPDPNTDWSEGEAYSEFLAKYTAPKERISFQLEEYGQQTLTFPEEEVRMRILYFVRDLTSVGTEGTAYVLGGVYPESNYRNQASTVLKRDENSSISLQIDLNTGLDSGKMRKELVNEFINQLIAEGL